MRTIAILLLVSTPCSAQSIILETLRPRSPDGLGESQEAAAMANRQANAAIREAAMLSRSLRLLREKTRSLEEQIRQLEEQLAQKDRQQQELRKVLAVVTRHAGSISAAAQKKNHKQVTQATMKLREVLRETIDPLLGKPSTPGKADGDSDQGNSSQRPGIAPAKPRTAPPASDFGGGAGKSSPDEQSPAGGSATNPSIRQRP
jgi:hypothetical protein